MKIVGTMEILDNVPTIYPYKGSDLIHVMVHHSDERGTYYTIAINGSTGTYTFDSVFVFQSAMKVTYLSWSNSVNNPYVLLGIVLVDLTKSISAIKSMTEKFLCDLPINSHFAILHEEHMLKALVKILHSDFPDLAFDATSGRVRVNCNWVTV